MATLSIYYRSDVTTPHTHHIKYNTRSEAIQRAEQIVTAMGKSICVTAATTNGDLIYIPVANIIQMKVSD